MFNSLKQTWENIETHHRQRIIVAASISAIILAGWAIYWNSLSVPFFFDDHGYIIGDHGIRMTAFNWPSLKNAIFNSIPRFRPLPNLSFALNYYTGMFNVAGYHVVNIVIHILSGIFLFLFFSTTLRIDPFHSDKRNFIAFFAALLWLVIPVHTQAVTYICQRMTSMAAMFYILSLWLYAAGRMSYIAPSHRKSRGILFFILCALAGFCALGSKQITAPLPVVILLYEWFFFQDLKIRWSKQKLMWLLLTGLIFSALILYFTDGNPLRRILAAYPRRDFSLAERVMTEWRVVIYYISLLIFPASSRLNLNHDYPLSQSFLHPPTTLITLFAIIFLLGLAIKTAPRERLTAFCTLWFFLNLLIESTVIGIEIIFEHRIYLPSMMVCLLFVYWAFRFFRRKWFGVVCLVGIIFFFSIETVQRNQIWNDDLLFWTDCAQKSPANPRALNNLGQTIWRTGGGDIDQSLALYTKAIQLDPTYPEPWLNWGHILIIKNKIDPAIARIEKCLAIKSSHYKAYTLLGTAYYKKGDFDKAIRYYNRALKTRPLYAKAHYGLAQTFIELNETDKAMQILTFLLKLMPHNREAHNDIAKILIGQQKYSEAIKHLSLILEVAPVHVEANINMGDALVHLNHIDQAVFHYQNAASFDPGDDKALNRLARLYQNTGRFRKALQAYESIIKLTPEDSDALFHLAVLHAKLSQFDRSIKVFKRIIDLQPDNPKPYYNIACIYAGTSKENQAIEWLQKAVENGYDNWLRIQTDPDLTNIRNTPYVSNLLKTHFNREP